MTVKKKSFCIETNGLEKLPENIHSSITCEHNCKCQKGSLKNHEIILHLHFTSINELNRKRFLSTSSNSGPIDKYLSLKYVHINFIIPFG